MWGLRYELDQPPDGVIAFARAGEALRGYGAGTVTIRNEAECGFRARLPLMRSLPPAICGRLAVAIRPRQVSLGRSTRVRFRVSRRVGALSIPMAGARVRLGRQTVRTDRRGRASLRYRPRGRPGRRGVSVAVRGLRTVRSVLSVARR